MVNEDAPLPSVNVNHLTSSCSSSSSSSANAINSPKFGSMAGFPGHPGLAHASPPLGPAGVPPAGAGAGAGAGNNGYTDHMAFNVNEAMRSGSDADSYADPKTGELLPFNDAMRA